jgi:preprotein translocase subunit SecA
MDRLKMPENEPIEASMVSRAIESAQRKVEGRNFDIRKQLLEYDDVANDQRRETYQLRNQVLESDKVSDLIANLREDVFRNLVLQYLPMDTLPEQWDIESLEKELLQDWSISIQLKEKIEQSSEVDTEDVVNWVQKAAQELYQSKLDQADAESFAGFERSVFLYSMDTHWREHLASLDYLRQGIHLRGYAQKDPKQEYRKESFALYAEFLEAIKRDITKTILTVQIQSSEQLNDATDMIQDDLSNMRDVQYEHAQITDQSEEGNSLADANTGMKVVNTIHNTAPKVGRNDPCPCGSGKKYKHCHGQVA